MKQAAITSTLLVMKQAAIISTLLVMKQATLPLPHYETSNITSATLVPKQAT